MKPTMAEVWEKFSPKEKVVLLNYVNARLDLTGSPLVDLGQLALFRVERVLGEFQGAADPNNKCDCDVCSKTSKSMRNAVVRKLRYHLLGGEHA